MEKWSRFIGFWDFEFFFGNAILGCKPMFPNADRFSKRIFIVLDNDLIAK